MERGESSSGNKPDRKTIEKNRRILIKNLCYELVSLIPDRHFNPAKEFLSQKDQLDQASSYIKDLRDRIDELRRRKAQLTNDDVMDCNTNMGATTGDPNVLPILTIQDLGSDVEVVITSGPNKNFLLHQIISIIEEEGAQVMNVSIATIGDMIFHNIHAQVKVPRVGVDTSRISERIHELIS